MTRISSVLPCEQVRLHGSLVAWPLDLVDLAHHSKLDLSFCFYLLLQVSIPRKISRIPHDKFVAIICNLLSLFNFRARIISRSSPNISPLAETFIFKQSCVSLCFCIYSWPACSLDYSCSTSVYQRYHLSCTRPRKCPTLNHRDLRNSESTSHQ